MTHYLHCLHAVSSKHIYPVSPKSSPFYFLNNSVKNYPVLIISGMLNLQKIGDEHLTDLSTSTHLSYVATSPWEIQKKSFLTLLLFIYFRLFTLSHKKTNSNCCTAALAVYLLLFSASYYLHSPSTASGARYRRSACIDVDVLRLAAVACWDMG